MLDPDDYMYVDTVNRIRKTFPSLTWDDVIRKGLEADKQESLDDLDKKLTKR